MDKLSTSYSYSYEEYQVQTVLEKLVPNEENLRPGEVDGSLLPQDFYVRNGIPQIKLDGETVVEVKAALSISSLTWWNANCYFFDQRECCLDA